MTANTNRKPTDFNQIAQKLTEQGDRDALRNTLIEGLLSVVPVKVPRFPGVKDEDVANYLGHIIGSFEESKRNGEPTVFDHLITFTALKSFLEGTAVGIIIEEYTKGRLSQLAQTHVDAAKAIVEATLDKEDGAHLDKRKTH